MTLKVPYKTLKSELKFLFSSETMEVMNGIDVKKSIKTRYVNILPQKSSFWSGKQLVNIIRENQVFSDFSSGNQADRFVHELETVLDKLILSLDFNGQPISLENQQQLWESWLQMREKLSAGYKGDWIDQVLMRVDKKMLPSDSLPVHVTQDMFLSEYFNKVSHSAFPSDGLVAIRTVYAWLPDEIELRENWRLEDNNDFYRISVKGNVPEARMHNIRSWLIKSRLPDLKNEKIEVCSEGTFDMDRKTGWCSAYQTSYVLKIEDLYLRALNNKLMST